jgi:hypothetical protein
VSKAVVLNMKGEKFLVEVDDTLHLPARLQDLSGTAGSNLPANLKPISDVKQLERDFAEVKDLIVKCCDSLHDAVKAIPEPETFSVEFGVKLAGEAGFPTLTKVSGEATFKVTIQWKKETA